MLATITAIRRQAAIPDCYVDNSPLNYTDPTGLRQAGNPLTNLFAGGYSGGKVSAPKIPAVNFAGGVSAYSTVKAVDQYYVDQGLQNLANPNPLSGGTFSYTAKTSAELLYGQLNPHGKPVGVETFEGYHAGDETRNLFNSLAAYVEQPTPRLANDFGSGASRQVAAWAIRQFGGSVGEQADTLLPPSEPTRVTYFKDGPPQVDLTPGPKSGDLFQQGLALLPVAIPRGRAVPSPKLQTPNRVRFVDEAPSKYGNAQDYEDAATGARSNVATGQRQVPVLDRRLPNGATSQVRFDGIDQSILIDRKVSVTTFQKSKDQALRQSEALRQNGLTGRWEVPNQSQANRAQKLLRELKIDNIHVRVEP